MIVYTISQTKAMIARGGRMNSVSAAALSTGFLDDFKATFRERATKSIARAARPGLPKEIGDVIVDLASPQNAWIKGQDTAIDGSMAAMTMSDTLGFASEG